MKVSNFPNEAVEQKCLRITALHPGSPVSRRIFILSSSLVAQSIANYYNHMNLIYSFECFLIITDTKIKRHEKVRMNYQTGDLEFKKIAKHAITCYQPSTPRALLHYQIWSSEKENWVLHLYTL